MLLGRQDDVKGYQRVVTHLLATGEARRRRAWRAIPLWHLEEGLAGPGDLGRKSCRFPGTSSILASERQRDMFADPIRDDAGSVRNISQAATAAWNHRQKTRASSGPERRAFTCHHVGTHGRLGADVAIFSLKQAVILKNPTHMAHASETPNNNESETKEQPRVCQRMRGLYLYLRLICILLLLCARPCVQCFPSFDHHVHKPMSTKAVLAS
ncbi:hypothetical protein LZ31DRAFT_170059 [Colletotrichum somersetense]|nr:hypothetical protein LZ31DRAFT_170059 [Colletotrichum somersetense]